MSQIPRAVPSAESNPSSRAQARTLSVNCRSCNHTFEIHLTESDFLNENGTQVVAISKTFACPSCGTMNTRYFSWEVEFGTAEQANSPAAVPTGLADVEALTPEFEDEQWHPEVMQAEMVEPQGTKWIGTEESWIELTWNLEHRFAWITLYTAEGENPIKTWQHTLSIPEMPYEEDVDIVRHLTHLANLCYSFFAASPDAVDLIPPMIDVLLDFRHFLERLED